MKIIFCQSYLSIPKTITITETEKSDFVIISSDLNVYKFFCKIYNNKNLYYINNTKPFFSFNPITIISNFIFNLKLKNSIIKKFSDISTSEVVFSLVAFAPEIAFAVKILSKKNTISYYIPTKLPDSFKKAKGIEAWVRKVILLKFYGLHTNALNNDKIIILKYSKQYFNSINSKLINITTNEAIIKKIAYEKLDIPHKKILFLTGGLPDIGIISKKEYIAKTDKIIELLKPENLILKLHPRFNQKYSKEDKLQEICSNIPAYFTLYMTDIVISFQSSALYEAANIDKKAISLMKIYTFVTEEYKTNYINYLTNNLKPGKKIFFPNTLSELIKIIQ